MLESLDGRLKLCVVYDRHLSQLTGPGRERRGPGTRVAALTGFRGLGYVVCMGNAEPKESLGPGPEVGFSGDYWKKSLAGFYQGFPQRLVLYLLVGCAFGVLTYGTVLVYYGPAWLLSDLAPLTLNVLCSVLLFAGAFALVDLGASRLAGVGWAYSRRTVSRQWLVMLAGFVLAYTIYRAASRHLSELYGPWLLGYGRTTPGQPLEFLPEFVLLFLFWMLTAYLCIRYALWSQGAAPTANESTPHAEEPQEGRGKAPFQAKDAFLTVQNQDQDLAIPISRITHVIVEDHYCRLFQNQGDEIKSIFLRMPLRSLEKKLPAGQFARIHRSHLVNLGHVSGWRMVRGQRHLVMDHGIEELPVSRHRYGKIKHQLEFLERR